MTGFTLPLFIGEPLAIVLVALVADFLLGGLPVIGTVLDIPQALFRGMSRWCDRRLNRPNRSPASRRARGGLVAVGLIAVATVLGYGLAQVNRSIPYGWGAEMALVAALIAQRRIVATANRVRRFLRRGELGPARATLAAMVSHDVEHLDDHAVARSTVERTAMAVCDGVVGPAFWYLVLGLPGMFAYRAAAILAARVGRPTPADERFGQAAVAFDSLFNLVPAPISGLLLSVGAMAVPGANPFRALAVMVRGGFTHARPGIGWPVGAMAGALNLALAGPRHYHGTGVTAPWLGAGRARADAADIGRAIYLQIVASIMMGGVLAALGVLWAGGG